MKPETLEAIKKEAEEANGYVFFNPKGDKAIVFEEGFITGATKYAELLESEREKSEKLCEAVKSLLLICGHPTSEIYEDAKKVFDEYKTTSK